MNTTTAPTASALFTQYRHHNRRRLLMLGMLALALLLSLCRDLVTGPAGLGLADIWQQLGGSPTADPALRIILLDVRLPYALMALAVGGALGLAGAQMQTVLDNPLASPFTLGLAAASTLGASLAIVLLPDLPWLPGELTVPLSAFAMALASSMLITLLLRWHGGGSQTLVLFGIALMFALEALVSLMHFLADNNALEQIVFWGMGSLARANWHHVAIVGITLLVCFLLAMRRAWALTLMCAGEAQAESLGIDVEKMRRRSLIEVSLLTATALCFVGTIGFVGLVGPHIARLLVGEQHRYFLPASTLCGALLLSLASIASKSLLPGMIIPISIVTALVGVPLFMTLIFRRSALA